MSEYMNVCLEKATSGNRRLSEFRKNISLTRSTFSLTRTGVREISCQNQLYTKIKWEVCSKNGSCLTQYMAYVQEPSTRRREKNMIQNT